MEYTDKLGRRHFVLCGCVGDGPFTPFFTVRRGRPDQEDPVYLRDVDDPSWGKFQTMPEAIKDATEKAIEWIDADAASGDA
jgi:hypothetical protein